MLGIIIREQMFYVSDPRASQVGIAELDPWWAIHIEAGDFLSFDPAAVNQQAIMDERGLSRYPRQSVRRAGVSTAKSKRIRSRAHLSCCELVCRSCRTLAGVRPRYR